MQLGAVLPQQEIGFDPAELRRYAVELERLGIAELEAFDHVLGGDASHWDGGPPAGFAQVPYTADDPFHEPLILFSHLAAVTDTLGFATSVLVLPQRQTALVAKQAAEVDHLSGGRLRLGIGVGWNALEFEGLGEPFRGRGRRAEEQVDVLRRLFAEPVVDVAGRWHRIDRAGINPLPTRRAIPIWIGGTSDAALGRVARGGDGWVMGAGIRADNAATHLARLDRALAAAGRSRREVGVSAWMPVHGRSADGWRAELAAWRGLGVDRVGLVTRGAGIGPSPHLDIIRCVLDATDGRNPR